MNSTLDAPISKAAIFEKLNALENNDSTKSTSTGFKTTIVRSLQEYVSGKAVPQAPALPLVTDQGSIISDSFESYLSNDKFYSTGPFVKLSQGDAVDFQWEIETGIREELEKFKDRSYFDLGRFLHLAVLEPEKWESVIVEPEANRTMLTECDKLITFWESELLKRGVHFESSLPHEKLPEKKAYINALKAICPADCVEAKHALIIQVLHDRWKNYADGLWYNIIAAAHKEVSIYGADYKGLPVRIRPDGMLFENQIGVKAIVSVKTTSASTLRQYRNQCASLGYNVKEAAYCDIASHVTGMKISNTIQIVFQTVAPFHVGVFLFNQTDLQVGRELFNDAIKEGKELMASGIYPGWEERALPGCHGLIDFEMPAWSVQDSPIEETL